jgi:hypothetical protein
MPADHKKIAFEATIEESLLTHRGFLKGDPEAFDREPDLDCGELFAFLRGSQPETWSRARSMSTLLWTVRKARHIMTSAELFGQTGA